MPAPYFSTYNEYECKRPQRMVFGGGADTCSENVDPQSSKREPSPRMLFLRGIKGKSATLGPSERIRHLGGTIRAAKKIEQL